MSKATTHFWVSSFSQWTVLCQITASSPLQQPTIQTKSTLQSLTDLMLSTVFASVNNLYHRPAQKRQIDRQHSRLYHAVIERLPEQAQRAARDHINSIRDNLQEIEQEEQRLVRATMRLEGWA